MTSNNSQLHIFFLPALSPGHMIPVIEMAKLVASRGVMATIVTTAHNLAFVSRTISTYSTKIKIVTIKFPYAEVGLPEGCEIIDSDTPPDILFRVIKALRLLQEPMEQLLSSYQPDCLVADAFFSWATNSAAKFNIPRLVFHVACLFSLCASHSIELYEPQKKVSSDSETFIIPSLPGEIKLTKMQLPADLPKTGVEAEYINKMVKAVHESVENSYGFIINSFYELEKDYVDYYRNVIGRKAWHIGPLSLCHADNIEEKSQRGKESSIAENECLKWLDSRKPDSVVYVGFGSLVNFSDSQLMEIALGLEASEKQFIWVVKKSKRNEQEKEEWLPEGFEKRTVGKGLIIRGWAPQLLIMDHEAVGGFVTHCGWNSTLEGVCGGVVMATWPVSYEQIYTEKLVTDVLKIGVSVGAQTCDGIVGGIIKSEAIEKAVNRIMEGIEAEEMRSRAKAFAKKARQSVKEGGSSYSDLNSLIEELSLKSLKH
ncbi:Glycosyltransferase [Quillaja saponaria]|uniref:Glycosyltransferase n=1 Tax=Quillaja saponaria TaxID=32244 RepID=A0AAD7M539_QUISA|nr:Glycosyltransferase [Quillaja saponaria]WEU75101.1 UGT73B44 [Quillaja saponaria]